MRLATVRQTVAYLHGAVSAKTIYGWVANRTLKATKIKSHILIDLDFLDTILVVNSTGPKTESPPAKEPEVVKEKKKRSSGGQIDLW